MNEKRLDSMFKKYLFEEVSAKSTRSNVEIMKEIAAFSKTEKYQIARNKFKQRMKYKKHKTESIRSIYEIVSTLFPNYS